MAVDDLVVEGVGSISNPDIDLVKQLNVLAQEKWVILKKYNQIKTCAWF